MIVLNIYKVSSLVENIRVSSFVSRDTFLQWLAAVVNTELCACIIWGRRRSRGKLVWPGNATTRSVATGPALSVAAALASGVPVRSVAAGPGRSVPALSVAAGPGLSVAAGPGRALPPGPA